MKILYVIESLTHGGKERRLISLIKELVLRENVSIEIIILSQDIHYKEIYDFNVNVHLLKRNIKKDIRIISKFNKIVKKFKPDLVHCWDNIAAIHFGPICKIKRIPFLNSMISTAPPANLVKTFSKRYISTALSYPFSDVILANCNAGLESFRVPKSKGKCIYNGFDFNRKKIKESKDTIRDKFQISTKYIAGMSGGFYDRKDYKTFIDAGKLILKNRKDITFVAIGDGPNLNAIKERVGVEYMSNFRFVGKQVDVDSIVNIFDIGILSSNMKCHGEGISNSIMEYMIFEKPVVATNGGGTSELVINNETGFLVEEDNANHMAEKIEFLLANPIIASEMGRKGKKRIENHFSIDVMIEKFFQLYEEILKGK